MSVQTESFAAWQSAGAVEAMLRRWPSWLEDLEVSKAKLDRTDRASGVSGSRDAPAPMRFDHMWCIDAAAESLRGLMVVLDMDLGRPVRFRSDVADVADELAGHARWLSEADAAAPYLEHLFNLERTASRLVDLPQEDERIFLGRCDGWLEEGKCTADLYADAADEYVMCSVCGSMTSVVGRRNRVLQTAGERTARPKVIARMLKSQGVVVTVDRIHQWASRKRKSLGRAPLERAGEDWEGKPVYRVADVYALCLEAQERRRSG